MWSQLGEAGIDTEAFYISIFLSDSPTAVEWVAALELIIPGNIGKSVSKMRMLYIERTTKVEAVNQLSVNGGGKSPRLHPLDAHTCLKAVRQATPLVPCGPTEKKGISGDTPLSEMSQPLTNYSTLLLHPLRVLSSSAWEGEIMCWPPSAVTGACTQQPYGC